MSKKAPFEGVKAWYRNIKKKDGDDAALTYREKRVLRSERASVLFRMCNQPGDVLLLTFCGSRHSALVIFQSFVNEWGLTVGQPIYLSFGSEGFVNEGGDEDSLISDMINFEDLVKSENIVKLKGWNTQAMLKKWSIVGKSAFNPITNNCSKIAKKLLLCGAKQYTEKEKLKNNCFMQMPLNTHKMAQEIKFMQDKDMRKVSGAIKSKHPTMDNGFYPAWSTTKNTTFCFETSL